MQMQTEPTTPTRPRPIQASDLDNYAVWDFVRFLIRVWECAERRANGEWVEAGSEHLAERKG